MTAPRRGRIQRWLLDTLPVDGKVMPFCEILWQVAKKDGEIRKGEIRESYESSVKRALHDLVERGEAVSGGKRRIITLDSMCRTYPYRTRRKIILDMRARLLPLVREYAADVRSRKTDADIEEWTLWRYNGDKRHDKDKREEPRQTWPTVDLSMRQLLSRVGVDEANAIIDLLVRGRHLFDRSPSVTSGRTFMEVSDAALPIVQRVDPSAAATLEHLARKMFPRVRVKVALLKREIYKCVSQHRYEPEALLPDFEDFLLEREPDYVSSLLTRWASSPTQARAGTRGTSTPQKPPGRGERVLDKLLLRDLTKPVPVYGRPTSLVVGG